MRAFEAKVLTREVARLRGAWKAVAVQVNGESLPPGRFDFRIKFSDDRFSASGYADTSKGKMLWVGYDEAR